MTQQSRGKYPGVVDDQQIASPEHAGQITKQSMRETPRLSFERQEPGLVASQCGLGNLRLGEREVEITDLHG
jgi:hypothetical protein